ncbi:MAG: hypothetical protein AAF810_02270 [Cyanobacteria bacterium P01_D01_bin.36]
MQLVPPFPVGIGSVVFKVQQTDIRHHLSWQLKVLSAHQASLTLAEYRFLTDLPNSLKSLM